MSKKKTKKKSWGFSTSSQSLDKYLKQVEQYIFDKQWSKAKKLLEDLEQRFSYDKEIFLWWLTLAYEQSDWTTYQKKAEEFILKHPDEPDAYLALSSGCLNNLYPLLALQTFQDFCAKFPNHPRISEAHETIKDIESSLPELLKDYSLNEI